MEWIASGIFSLLIGLVGLWTALKHLKSRAELNNWRTTKGKVLERGTFKPNVPRLAPPAFHYAPLVKYTYSVEGKEFVNNCIHPARIQAPSQSTQEWAQKESDSFPDEVLGYYNFSDPSESYLIQTSRVLLLTVAVGSSFMILFGLLILLVQTIA
jgi:hypothetical protein